MLPEVHFNISLKQYNTFGIDVSAAYFTTFTSASQLIQLLSNDAVRNKTKLILGGGSNVLFTKNVDGIVLHNRIEGIQIISEDSQGIIY